MIAYPRSDTSSQNPEPPSVRIIGVGNAGVHLADRLQLNGHGDVVVMNSDTQSLQSSIASNKIALGPMTTHGLGAGGDPEVGQEAAQESRSEIRSALEGATIVFVCAGLGGGTASGVIPITCGNREGDRSSRLFDCHFAIQLRGTSPHQTGDRRPRSAGQALQRVDPF